MGDWEGERNVVFCLFFFFVLGRRIYVCMYMLVISDVEKLYVRKKKVKTCRNIDFIQINYSVIIRRILI